MAFFCALASNACATVHEKQTSTPYERAEIVHRMRLAGDEWLEVSARKHALGAEIKVAQVAFCSDEVVVSRGLHSTTQRTISSGTRTAEWVTFGSLVGLTLAMGAAGSSCDPDPHHVCSNMAEAVGLTFAAAALVSGVVLLTDSLRSVDGSEDQPSSSTTEHRVQVCERRPKRGVRIDVIVGEMRASAATDEDGETVLEVGHAPGEGAETGMTLTLDGVLLGTAVLSSEWRSAHVRDQRGRVGRGKSSR